MPNIKARITNKHDTEANWKSAVNFTPLAGEVIVYDVDANHAYPRFKVGDGKTLVSALPFSTDVLEKYITETELASALNETTSAINKNIATIDEEVAAHVAAINNPHQVNKAQVGLANVVNVLQYSASNPPPYGTLTFTGAVEDSFTASTSKTIEIPTIAGPTGPTGATGSPGADGDNGYTWVPTVAANGQITWASTQAGPGTTPAARNIMGPTGAPGQDGSDGTNATITGANATITGGYGTPGVNVTAGGTASARSFTFAFSNLRGATGNTGATGAAAGFGTPTVSTTTGAPGSQASVSINATGANTAKVFDFDFVIPQGPTGPAGTNGTNGSAGAAAGFGIPTVTTTTGNPGTNASVTVIANTSSPNTAKVFNFAFTIPRGNTGATGGVGPAANITGASATITNTVGTPTVSVTPGGTNQTRTFAFAFANLKGATGDPGQDGQDGQDGIRGLGFYRTNSSLATSATTITWSSISTRPSDNIMRVGDIIVSTNGNAFVCTAQSTYSASGSITVSYRMSLTGPTGPTGATGSVASVTQSGSGFVSNVTLNSTSKVLTVTKTKVTIDDGEL